MPIQLRCTCGQRFAVADRYAGTRLRCPKCNSVNRIPEESSDRELAINRQAVLAAASFTGTPIQNIRSENDLMPLADRPARSNGNGVAGAFNQPNGHGPPGKSNSSSTGSVTLPGSPFRPPRVIQGYRAEPHRAQAAYWLAAGLALIALFQLAPALMQGSPASAPSWAAFVWLIVIAQLGYAAWMVCSPDWSTIWVCMVVTAVVAAIYALAFALVIVTPQSSIVWFDLDEVRQAARLWCCSVVLLAFLLAYACSRVGYAWRKAYWSAA